MKTVYYSLLRVDLFGDSKTMLYLYPTNKNNDI
ncbi:hypothetical protein SAMN05216436_103239 [bacterium A37T11]|nr:hypothetical protein SAMN05216436_103239 [bacterium A37T11]